MQLRKPLSLILIAILMFSSTVVLLPAETALAEEGDDKMDEGVAFLVRIENISADSGLPTPFAPGVWVLHSEPGPLFIEGEADKGYGLEALAEDGDPSALAEALNGMGLHAGVFNTPDGADGPGVALPGSAGMMGAMPPGSAYVFEVKAAPDTPYLSFATMFVQSNDLFIGPGEAGIALFDMDGMAMEGMQDVTAEIQLWDAGTEANEEPGVGGEQAPRQSGPNMGPPEIDGAVRVVDDGYTYPEVSALVKVTIDKAMMMDAEMEKDDEMMSDKDDKMMSDKDGMMGGIMLMEEGDTPYTVAAGDTLGSISRRAYGASKYWEVICSANGLANCNLIHVGDELMLPSHADAMAKMDMMMMGEKDGMMGEKDEMMSDKDDGMMSDKDDKMMSDKDDKMMSDKDGMMMGDIMLMEDGDTPYTVVGGDTLGSIARRAYGKADYWKAICSANELENCDRIDIGDELLLPTQAEAEEMMDSMMMDDGMDAMDKKDDM
ncbi:MAG: LysM peptidoglycan-binding domain-containing protein [Caldilineaceae bacterium SB0661_bin_32]|uniref:LysM peptidoglycan-binding domain-containing protein n=1 Tax=Caldilineaceae bacterium SB0661_bin_32 TaxID=2605255 RepID=A0A6B1D8Y2_9CHLR|nr:LysM peptidoglycan-binding domain-containing protein [Caldilineaceae bacterium SB0661_bin_32]